MLRYGLIVAALFGLAVACAPGEAEGWCVYGALLFGVVIAAGGALTAMIVDDGFLGKAPKKPPKAASRHTFRAGLAPLVDLDKKALGLSLVGDF